MTNNSLMATTERWGILKPTATKQCIGFMIGSTFFAVSVFPGFAHWAGATWTVLLPFIGAWFFTGAGFMQWALSGPMNVESRQGNGTVISAAWFAAMTQSLGTLAFNVRTTGELDAPSSASAEAPVWNLDAGGSLLFLVSGFFVIMSYSHHNKFWNPTDRAWWSAQINFIGCVAFGVSAIGAFVSSTGGPLDPTVANWGTLIGAACFFLSSAVVLKPTRSA